MVHNLGLKELKWLLGGGGGEESPFLHMIYYTLIDWYMQTVDVLTPPDCATRRLFQRYVECVWVISQEIYPLNFFSRLIFFFVLC